MDLLEVKMIPYFMKFLIKLICSYDIKEEITFHNFLIEKKMTIDKNSHITKSKNVLIA